MQPEISLIMIQFGLTEITIYNPWPPNFERHGAAREKSEHIGDKVGGDILTRSDKEVGKDSTARS